MQLSNIFKKSWIQFTILFLVINSIGLLGFFIYLPRSIFYYEYAFVILALVYFKKPSAPFLIFLILTLFDFLDSFSSIFLFKTDELFRIIKFIEYYHPSTTQILYGSLIIFYLIIVYKCLYFYQHSIKKNKKASLQFLFVIYFIIFSLDFLNGSSKLIDQKKAWIISTNNILSPLTNNYFYLINQYFQKKGDERVKAYSDLSPVFTYLQSDSISNELVIIVESWGLMNDSLNQQNLQEFINNKIKNVGFTSKWGITPFEGGTVSAGLKQLVNVKGDYHYYLNHYSKNETSQSIFDIKNKQGYQTTGFHSYRGEMFSREIWWPNIGIQKLYFRNNYILDKPTVQSKIYGEAPFPSIKDNLMFDYLLKKTSINSSKKQFTYFLTVNSHLPFRVINKQEVNTKDPILQYAISEEAKNQLIFIKNLMSYFIENLPRSNYQKIVIVGDHMPPFINARDRYFYNSKMVPYLYLYKD
jgi:hypothetical protein